jgi:predicted ATP-binding protein involved in virulence
MASPLGRLFCRKSYGGKSELESDRFYVKTLTLENFRCFEKVELGPFDQHFNLLVGTNGAGKSSVLMALANLFRPLALPDWDVKSDGRILKPSDVRVENRIGADGVRLQKLHMPGSVAATFEIGNDEWFGSENFTSRRSTSPSGIWGPLHSHHSQSSSDYLGRLFDSVYPLLAFYTAERPFKASESWGTGVEANFPGARGRAFQRWSRAGTSVNTLREWIKDQTLASLQHDLRVREAGPNEQAMRPLRQLNLIQEAIASAVEGSKTLEFDADRSDIVVQFEDGSRSDFSGMSDGQRALIGLVADIVRRACVLNAPYLGVQTLIETPGLVLIDELDLHLHPRWQRRVLADLKRIFPNIQFFATTHSPQIIGEARPEEIVMLTPTGQKRPMASYGMDSNWVLECVMEAEGRDPEIAKRIKLLFEAIESGAFEDARAMIAELREVIGEAPDVVAAESYIWNVEHDGEKAAE